MDGTASLQANTRKKKESKERKKAGKEERIEVKGKKLAYRRQEKICITLGGEIPKCFKLFRTLTNLLKDKFVFF